MNPRTLWGRVLVIVGGIAMLLGTVDPLEGSLLILPGSGLVALGMFLGKRERRTLVYWVWAFILIAVGVGAMFVLSAFGGIGGKSGHSMWWGILLLPYPVGWLMALAGGIAGLVRLFKARGDRRRTLEAGQGLGGVVICLTPGQMPQTQEQGQYYETNRCSRKER